MLAYDITRHPIDGKRWQTLRVWRPRHKAPRSLGLSITGPAHAVSRRNDGDVYTIWTRARLNGPQSRTGCGAPSNLYIVDVPA